MRRQRLASWISGRGRLRLLLLAVVALGSCGIALAFNGTHLLRGLEGSAVDARFSIRGTEKPPSNIVIVAIDDRSTHTLPYLYPYPRVVQADLLNRILAERPKAVTFDIQFTARSIFAANGKAVGLSPAQSKQLAANDDDPLGNAIQNSGGKVILDTVDNDDQGRFELFGLDSDVALKAIGNPPVGQGTFPDDPGGAIRRMDYSIGRIKTLGVTTAQVATGKRVDPKKFSGTTWIDFAGPTGTYKTVSYVDALNGKTAPGFFRNKIVVIGTTSSLLQDIHPTSTDSAMPGPELQANAINTALKGEPLKSFGGWVTVISIIILGAIVPLLSVWLRPVLATAVALAIAALFLVGEQLAFNGGKVGVIVYPLGALILAGVGSLAVQLLTEAFERLRVRDLFTRFVPEDVVDEVLASADGLRLGGIQREGTVMFTDLRGFTSLAESLTPARVIEILNRYLSEMSDAILDHGGTLVAYMGDGIMAVFGAPLPQDDHADRALSAAREMLDVRLPKFNAWLRQEDLSEGFKMGIGLNSGSVMSGHVGSERRVEYTAVGDTTNTASRIEAMTKGTPHQLLLADSTKEALSSPPDDLVFAKETEIRGRVEKIKLWTLEQTEPPPAETPGPAAQEAPAPASATARSDDLQAPGPAV
jgi:adenylate cyclase